MACPYLDYRRSDGDAEFDHERPYCTVADGFVSPMKADICNVRHGFHYEEDCEIFPSPPSEQEPGVDEPSVTSETTQ